MVLRFGIGLLCGKLPGEFVTRTQQIRHFAERLLDGFFILGNGDHLACLGDIHVGGGASGIEQRQDD